MYQSRRISISRRHPLEINQRDISRGINAGTYSGWTRRGSSSHYHRYWGVGVGATRCPISNFPLAYSRKISLSRTIILDGPRDNASVRPRIICRRTYFVIRRDIPPLRRDPSLRLLLLRPRPTLSEGGSPYRESDELLLRRYSCISMTHRFARDLSFNGVSRSFFLFIPPPLSPFVLVWVLYRQYRGGFRGSSGSMEDKWHVDDGLGVVRSDVCERKLGDLGVFYVWYTYMFAGQMDTISRQKISPTALEARVLM